MFAIQPKALDSVFVERVLGVFVLNPRAQRSTMGKKIW